MWHFDYLWCACVSRVQSGSLVQFGRSVCHSWRAGMNLNWQPHCALVCHTQTFWLTLVSNCDIPCMFPEDSVSLNVAIYLKCNYEEDGNQFKYILLLPKAQQVSSAGGRTGGGEHLTTVSAFPIGKIRKKTKKHPSILVRLWTGDQWSIFKRH